MSPRFVATPNAGHWRGTFCDTPLSIAAKALERNKRSGWVAQPKKNQTRVRGRGGGSAVKRIEADSVKHQGLVYRVLYRAGISSDCRAAVTSHFADSASNSISTVYECLCNSQNVTATVL